MKKILVIDDEEEILLFCKIAVQKKGYLAHTALTKVDARDQLRCDNYDLMIIDGTLALYIGENFLEEISKKYPDMGMIVISGFFCAEEKSECMQMNVYKCLDKPFSAEQLTKTIDCYFAGIPEDSIHYKYN